MATRVNLGSSPASVHAAALLAALTREGLTDVVVCPGARSQALALAAYELAEKNLITLHVRIDERSAAFFALGISRETGRPAAIITTSGTAVANLLPAVLEASHSDVPLLLLTADRPAELLGIRSNQTTVQAGIFGEFVRAEHNTSAPQGSDEVVAEAVQLALTSWHAAEHPHPGPVHLNLAYRAPLSSNDLNWDALWQEVDAQRETFTRVDEAPAQSRVVTLEDFVPTVVVAGHGAGAQAEAFAHEAKLPLLAEVVSGARFGREAITHYRKLLNDERLGGRVERVVVFGTPTLTREVVRLVDSDRVETVVVAAPNREYFNPGHRISSTVDAVVLGASYDSDTAHSWLGEWVTRDRELIAAHTTVHEPDLAAAKATGHKERSAYAKAEVAAMREPITRAMLAESLWRATWPHDRLVVGASKLIRVLDTIAQPRNIRAISNRGLAGIDGTVSTAVGVAVASQSSGDPGATRVLLGDLTALHDVGGLFWGAGEPMPRIQLFIGNDHGGSLFETLEVAQSAPADAFTRVLTTPHAVSFEHLAAAYGWGYQCITNRGELDAVLTAPVGAPTIIEVALNA